MLSSLLLNAQLITDSKAKLKTAKENKKLSSKVLRSANSKKTSSVSLQKVEPRFTNPNNRFHSKLRKLNSSPSREGSISIARVRRRYSVPNPFNDIKRKPLPRYSASGEERSYKKKSVFVPYSSGIPFRGIKYKNEIRYTNKRDRFDPRDYKLVRKKSPPIPFRSEKHKVEPRYSSGSPFTNKDLRVTQKYSPPIPFRGEKYAIQPRYSPVNPFREINFKSNPRYTGFKGRLAIHKETLKWYYERSFYTGSYKVRRKRLGDQHPSVNYSLAKNIQNPFIKNTLKNWSVFWTRFNKNTIQPKGVKEKVSKPKFDKKERVIWNN